MSRIIISNLALWLTYTAHYEEAELQFQKTIELDPSWGLAYAWRGQNYEVQGRLAEAVRSYKTSLELDAMKYAIGSLGHAYAKTGRIDDARAVLDQIEELEQTRYVGPVQRARVYAGLGELDRCFEWLEKAYQERSTDLMYLPYMPMAEDIEHDPRFAELLRRIGLEE